MKEHEQRVVDEKRGLDAKLIKLSAFINRSAVFDGLAEKDKNLLLQQFDVMVTYINILRDRIARFLTQ